MCKTIKTIAGNQTHPHPGNLDTQPAPRTRTATGSMRTSIPSQALRDKNHAGA